MVGHVGTWKIRHYTPFFPYTTKKIGYKHCFLFVVPLKCTILLGQLIWISHHHHHHHHISFMELGHLLTRSGLTYPEFSSKVNHDSFCQLWSSISLTWVIYFEAFYLYVVSSFSCIPVIFPKFVLFLTHLQFVHLFCNLSKFILLFFSCISSLLLLFFFRHLL